MGLIYYKNVWQYISFSDRKVSVSAETGTEDSAEFSADTEGSVIFEYSVSAKYSVPYVSRNQNHRIQANLSHFEKTLSHFEKNFGSGN